MDAEQPLRQHLHGPGVRALVTSTYGRCRVDIAVEPPSLGRQRIADLEVLYQPRDESGLPRGAPFHVFKTRVPLDRGPGSAQPTGTRWLPRDVRPGLARECHYRVTLL